jgi:hypothetical protein
MALITIATTDLPDPFEYAVTLRDMDSDKSVRDETGVLHRERVRAGVYEVKASFRVSKTQLKTITDAIAPASFSATIFDPTTSSSPTITMYAGDKSAKLAIMPGADSQWEITVSLIQY